MSCLLRRDLSCSRIRQNSEVPKVRFGERSGVSPPVIAIDRIDSEIRANHILPTRPTHAARRDTSIRVAGDFLLVFQNSSIVRADCFFAA